MLMVGMRQIGSRASPAPVPPEHGGGAGRCPAAGPEGGCRTPTGNRRAGTVAGTTEWSVRLPTAPGRWKQALSRCPLPRAPSDPPGRDWGTRGDSSRAPGSAVPALEPAPRVPAQVNRSRPALGSPARLFPPQRQRVPALVHVARRLDRPTWRELVTADHAPARLPPIQRNRPSTRLLHRVELRQLPPSLVLVHLRSPFSEPGPPAPVWWPSAGALHQRVIRLRRPTGTS